MRKKQRREGSGLWRRLHGDEPACAAAAGAAESEVSAPAPDRHAEAVAGSEQHEGGRKPTVQSRPARQGRRQIHLGRELRYAAPTLGSQSTHARRALHRHLQPIRCVPRIGRPDWCSRRRRNRHRAQAAME
ncbi:hypothetical protein GLOTRDRAFT_60063 [Gloeophyllum trabeum ATCC 11539]|uniref:Uncharacterized protein n=1 Tax=Gloeophyllum trabeum (strain ATCC 11539 / FP-39264 / Madison 617) TaxID=670483 RepID=S7RQ06_GLOTA|nr:uncharacterized protein GLOTRDRAFT_60063 [Gloeophyllum trabeum ATCC 11539]EPQ56665.1 hypothetical protein GLOTRDRAFT_60063 [Gloeophyllum trabeum ATCC 11539]